MDYREMVLVDMARKRLRIAAELVDEDKVSRCRAYSSAHSEIEGMYTASLVLSVSAECRGNLKNLSTVALNRMIKSI